MILNPAHQELLSQAQGVFDQLGALGFAEGMTLPADLAPVVQSTATDLIKAEPHDLQELGLMLLAALGDREIDGLRDGGHSADEVTRIDSNLSRFFAAQEDVEDEPPAPGQQRWQGSGEGLASVTKDGVAPPGMAQFVVGGPTPPLPQATTIILHGTNAKNAPWWQPGGSFFNYVNSRDPKLYKGADVFRWSGDIRDSARLVAASRFDAWVRARNIGDLDIIAHSHGGNVALIAAERGLRIRKLILLGTPISTYYIPSLDNIEMIFNVFSTNDTTQKLGAGFLIECRNEGRTLPDGDRITNIRATDDGTGGQPGHSDLHEPPTWRASNLDRLFSY